MIRSTGRVIKWLRSQHGVRVTEAQVRKLLRDEVVPEPAVRIGGSFVWNDAEQDALYQAIMRHRTGVRSDVKGDWQRTRRNADQI